MSEAVFPPEALATFRAAYPLSPAKLTHRLLSHPLLELGAIAELATRLDSGSIEYNPGNLPIGIAPEDVPKPALSVADTIRAIEDAGAWMVLKRIEQDSAYSELLHAIIAELAPIIGPTTGAAEKCEGFIFVTSPGSVTPFHFDPEHNILLQVRGSKTMTLFPGDDEQLFDPRVHELFHIGKHHRNLPYDESFAASGNAITIGPGEAIHVPVKAPHWVLNGPDVSISLSVTWRSAWSFAEADARAFNHILRGMGVTPASPAAFPARNAGKSIAYRAIRRAREAVGHRS